MKKIPKLILCMLFTHEFSMHAFETDGDTHTEKPVMSNHTTQEQTDAVKASLTEPETEQTLSSSHSTPALATHFTGIDFKTGTAAQASGFAMPADNTPVPNDQTTTAPAPTDQIPTTTSLGKRSVVQLTSNTINNLVSSNKKITTTDAKGTTTITTTSKDGTMLAKKVTEKDGSVTTTQYDKTGTMATSITETNVAGKMTQQTATDVTTGIVKTTTYKNAGVDKSSETVIQDPSKPDETITETRGADGNLIATITTNAKGDILSSVENKLTDPDKTQIQKLSTDQLNFSDALVTKIIASSPVLQKNETFGQTTASLLSDVNERIARVKNLDRATRDTIKKTFQDLQSAENKQNVLGKTPFLTQKNADGTAFTAEQAQQAYKQTIASSLIQSQIDNVFGKNALSGQSNFSLSPDAQKQMVDLITSSHIFDDTDASGHNSISNSERFQAIADMSDAIMNKISGPTVTGEIPLAVFKTTIDKDNNYTSSITNDANASSTSTVNNSGALTGRVFALPDSTNADGTLVKATKFTTTVDPTTGATTTVMSQDGQPDKSLTTYEDSLIQMAHDQLKAMANARSIIKATLWTGKQLAINLTPNPVSHVHAIYIGALAIPVIKIGSMAMGYKWSDPTVRTTISAAVEFTCGNSRGWLSADSNRFLTKGSAPARVIDTTQGAARIAYNTLTGKTSTPLTDLKTVFTEAGKTDPNEQYYHSLDDNLTEAAGTLMTWLTSSDTLSSTTASTAPSVTKLVLDSIASIPFIGIAGNKVIVANA